MQEATCRRLHLRPTRFRRLRRRPLLRRLAIEAELGSGQASSPPSCDQLTQVYTQLHALASHGRRILEIGSHLSGSGLSFAHSKHDVVQRTAVLCHAPRLPYPYARSTEAGG
jgi:hypothetical protein